MNQSVTVWLLVMLSSTTLLSARLVRVGTKKCSNVKQCLSQEGERVLPCCSLEYVSQNTKTSCSNLTILIDCDVLKLKGIARFEHCHNISIIGRTRSMPSTIGCEETGKRVTYPKNKELEDTKYMENKLWKQNWTSFKSHRFKHHYSKDSTLLRTSLLTQIGSRGLMFSDIHGLIMINLIITGCGQVRTSNTSCNSSVLLVNCSSVDIKYVSFEKNSDTAIYFVNMDGYVKLESVRFIKNQQLQNRSQHETKSFPGGLLVHFETMLGKPHNELYITNCTFDTNYAPAYYEFAPKLKPVLKDWMQYGLGGAVGLIFMNRIHGIDVKIINTKFLNNEGTWGAGLCIQFQQESYNNSVSIVGSEFSNNSAAMAGGGINIRFGRIPSSATYITNLNSVTFHNSVFQRNTGRYGGGVLVFASAGNIQTPPGSMVSFIGCSWLYNFGRYSPAVDVSPFRFDEQSSGFLPIPTFENCTFSHNRIIKEKQNHTLYMNAGVFVITHFEVEFSGSITFFNNSLTALYITWGRAVFQEGSRVLFSKNTGIRGGAVVMYGFSTFGVSDNSYFMFTGNSAIAVGGGIYYESTEQREYFEGRRCFLDYIGTTENVSRRNLKFVFKDNTAEESGTSIYSTSFYACFFRYYGTLSGRNITNFFGKIGMFQFDNVTNDHYNVSHQPFGTYGMKFYPSNKTILATPGKHVKLNIQLLDEFNEILPDNYVVKIDGDSNFALDSLYSLNGTTKVFGQPGENATLTVSTQHPIRSVHCQLNLSMISCSPGFYYNEHSKSCMCSSDNSEQSYSAITKCDYSKFLAYIDHGYWAGYYHDDDYNASNLYTALCPMQFCSTPARLFQTSILLPHSGMNLSQFMCGQRKGILCGFCDDGLSVHFHSRDYHCGRETLCSYGILFYIVSELLPVMAIFAVIVICNFNFTSGYVNGLILFSQVLDIVAIKFKDYQQEPFHSLPFYYKLHRHLEHIYQGIYDIFNLDFFRYKELSFCIFKSAGVMPILAMKYITTIFAFLLVLCLIALLNSNLCARVYRIWSWRSVNVSYIHGISAFLVLCYAQCTRVTFFILTWANLSGNSNAQPQKVAVTYYGGLHYLGKDHIPYALPALLCLCTVVLLPPILLIFYPLILQCLGRCGLSEHRVVVVLLWLSQIHRLVPIMDSFQASFKDNMRYFAGLYFLYRIGLLAVYSFWRSSTVFYALSEFLLISFLGIHAVAQPYTSHKHNIMDGLLFLNLAVINGLSAYTMLAKVEDKQLHGSQHNIKPPLYTGYCQILLIYLPLFVALGVLARYFFSKKCKRESRANELVSAPGSPLEEHKLLSADKNRRSATNSKDNIASSHDYLST